MLAQRDGQYSSALWSTTHWHSDVISQLFKAVNQSGWRWGEIRHDRVNLKVSQDKDCSYHHFGGERTRHSPKLWISKTRLIHGKLVEDDRWRNPRRLQPVQRGVRWEEVQQRSDAGRSAEVHWDVFLPIWSGSTYMRVYTVTATSNRCNATSQFSVVTPKYLWISICWNLLMVDKHWLEWRSTINL